MTFLSHINGLRAFAILAVILYHYRIPGFGGGYVGVDVFFVISGFLITAIITQAQDAGRFSFAQFYINRMRRIAPALIVMVYGSVLWGMPHLLSSDFMRLLGNAASALGFISNMAFLREASYFDLSAELKPLIHTWSLSVEGQFYLLLPFLALLPGFARRRRIIYLALFAASLLACIIITPQALNLAFYSFFTRGWEFLIGSLLALYGLNHPRLANSKMLALSGWAMLAYSITGFSHDTIFPGWHAIMPVLGSAIIILTGAQAGISRVLAVRPLQFFGNISYSLYLWHWPMYVATLHMLGHPLDMYSAPLLFAAAVAVSWLSYRFVEHPTRYNKTLWTNRRIVGLLVVTLLGIVALKGVAQATNGLSFRLPDYISRADVTAKDRNPRQKECFRDADGRKKSAEDYCVMGKTGAPPEVILWGDSHADQLQPLLEFMLQESGRAGQVATSGGCAPNLGRAGESSYTDPKLNILYPTCQSFNQLLLRHIDANPSIRTIVMGAQWYRYDTEFMSKQLKELACGFAKSGRRIILIGPVPLPIIDVPHSWAAAQMKQGSPIEEMTLPIEPQKPWITQFDVLSRDAIASCGNITTITPMQYFCRKDVCYTVKDGKALFRDTSHLSAHGADLIRPLLAKGLSR